MRRAVHPVRLTRHRRAGGVGGGGGSGGRSKRRGRHAVAIAGRCRRWDGPNVPSSGRACRGAPPRVHRDARRQRQRAGVPRRGGLARAWRRGRGRAARGGPLASEHVCEVHLRGQTGEAHAGRGRQGAERRRVAQPRHWTAAGPRLPPVHSSAQRGRAGLVKQRSACGGPRWSSAPPGPTSLRRWPPAVPGLAAGR